MNKNDLIEFVRESNSLSKAKAEEVVDSVMAFIVTQVSEGEEVKLIGLGTFLKIKRKSRYGRNPQTGEKITIPESYHPKFRPGAAFKEAVK
jgi:DNA-binding protein HU-beta